MRPLPCALGAIKFIVILKYDSKQTCDYTKQSNTLYEGSCKDHVRTNVTSSFRLSSDRLYRTATDLTDTYASTKRSDTSTDSTTSMKKPARPASR